VAAIEQIVGWPMGQDGEESYRGRKCISFITENDHSKVQDVANLLRKQISNSIIVLRKTTYSQIIVRL
jgi:hypothetical protein